MFKKTNRFLYSYNFYSLGAAIVLIAFFGILYQMFQPLLGRMACPFKTLTGIPCPTCGSTRFGLSLIEGDFMAAFFYNPLFFTLGLVFVLNTLFALLLTFRKKYIQVEIPLPWQNIFRIIAILLLLLNWIYEWKIFPMIKF